MLLFILLIFLMLYQNSLLSKLFPYTIFTRPSLTKPSKSQAVNAQKHFHWTSDRLCLHQNDEWLFVAIPTSKWQMTFYCSRCCIFWKDCHRISHLKDPTTSVRPLQGLNSQTLPRNCQLYPSLIEPSSLSVPVLNAPLFGHSSSDFSQKLSPWKQLLGCNIQSCTSLEAISHYWTAAVSQKHTAFLTFKFLENQVTWVTATSV